MLLGVASVLFLNLLLIAIPFAAWGFGWLTDRWLAGRAPRLTLLAAVLAALASGAVGMLSGTERSEPSRSLVLWAAPVSALVTVLLQPAGREARFIARCFALLVLLEAVLAGFPGLLGGLYLPSLGTTAAALVRGWSREPPGPADWLRRATSHRWARWPWSR